MPENLSQLSSLQKSRSWKFYAIVTFAGTLLLAGTVYLAFTLYHQFHPFRPPPAKFDGIGWRIEAEDYDVGGEGVGWHDSFPGNILYEHNPDPDMKRPGEYRKDDVEIMSKNPGQLNVGFVLAGEWLAYTMDVPESGMYDLDLNVAAMTPGRLIHFELDGRQLPEMVTLPVTGDWARFEVVTMPGGVQLTKGRHTLKLVFDESFMNVDWLRLTPRNAAASGSLTR